MPWCEPKYNVPKAQCYKTSSTQETKWCVRYSSPLAASSTWSGSHGRAENRPQLAHTAIFMGPTLNWKLQGRSASSACLILRSRSAPPSLNPTWGSPENGGHLSHTHDPLPDPLSHQLCLLGPQNSPEYETPHLEEGVEYIHTQIVRPQYFAHQASRKYQTATKFTMWLWASDLIVSGPPFLHPKKGTNNTYFSSCELSELFSKKHLSANYYSNEPYYHQKWSTMLV